jgi:hypothetical protein
MVAMLERNLSTNMQLMESMTTSQDEYRRDLEERFRLFSQTVQAPIIQAVTTSTEIAQATNAMVGTVLNLRADLAKIVHEAEEANRLADLQRMEAQQQALQSAQELAHAQDALTRHRGETTARGALAEDRPLQVSLVLGSMLLVHLLALSLQLPWIPERKTIRSLPE